MSSERYREAIDRLPKKLQPRRFHQLLKFYENEKLEQIPNRDEYPEDNQQIYWLTKVLRQTSFVRSFAFFRSALNAVVDDNFYAMTTLARSHIETTGIMGNVFKILRSHAAGNRDDSQAKEALSGLLFGTRNKEFQSQGAPPMTNILTIIAAADKELSHVTGIADPPENLLMGFYESLSEFAHPNFHSNSIIVRPYEKSPCEIKEADLDLIGILGVSGHAFGKFHEALGPSSWKSSDRPF